MSVVEKKQLEVLQSDMNEAIARGDEALYFELNREFHELICKGAQSKSLASIIAVQRQRLAGFRAAQPASPTRFEAATDEHREIVSAILSADPERAYNAMRDHTARLSIVVLGRLKKQHSARASA